MALRKLRVFAKDNSKLHRGKPRRKPRAGGRVLEEGQRGIRDGV